LRSATVPSIPNSEIEEFKRCTEFLLIEHCVLCAEHIVQNVDSKFDLESPEGNKAAKRFLKQLEHMAGMFEVQTQPRD